MNVWRLITHHSDPEGALKWSLKNGRIAIGWGRTGDIRDYISAREIVEAVREEYSGIQNAPLSGGQLWNFCHKMTKDDLVILSTGKYRAAVVQIQDDYDFHPAEEAFDGGDYRHQRKVQTTRIDPNRLWQLAGSQPVIGQNIRWTLFKCLRSVATSDL